MVIVLVVLAADRWAAHILCTFEARLSQVIFECHIKVLRAGFAEHVETFVTSFRQCIERLGCRHVHDVQRHVACNF